MRTIPLEMCSAIPLNERLVSEVAYLSRTASNRFARLEYEKQFWFWGGGWAFFA